MILERTDAITIHEWVPNRAGTHVAGRRAAEAVEKKGLLRPAQPRLRPGTRRNATDQSRQESKPGPFVVTAMVTWSQATEAGLWAGSP